MRVVITGGAGFIGRRLATRLSNDGHDVVVIDSLLAQVHAGQLPHVDGDFVQADLRDERALARVMRGADVVHHLAAETGVGQSQYEISRYVGANTFGTAVVIQQALHAGVQQMVIASSRAVYGEGAYVCPRCTTVLPAMQRQEAELKRGQWDLRCPDCRCRSRAEPTPEDSNLAPSSIYGITKLQQEQLAAMVSTTHGLNTTTLRLFNVFGPGQSLKNPYVGVLGVFFRRLRLGLPVELYEDGEMLRDFVYVDDVVEAFARCTGDPRSFGATWNVGSGQAVTLGEVVAALASALRVRPTVEITGRYRVGDVRHAIADVNRLERELGYRPTTTLADGIHSFVDWAVHTDADASDVAAESDLRSWNLLRHSAG